MGCGSSSLKGEKVEGVGEGDIGPPAKKVKTNFSDVDFSSNASADRRGTVAVAPDEHRRRPTKVSEASAEGATGLSRPHSKENVDAGKQEGAMLQPYRSNDADANGLADPMHQKVEASQPNLAQDTTTATTTAATHAPEIEAETQPRSVGDAIRQA